MHVICMGNIFITVITIILLTVATFTFVIIIIITVSSSPPCPQSDEASLFSCGRRLFARSRYTTDSHQSAHVR